MQHSRISGSWFYENEMYEACIYLHNGRAIPAYAVSFFCDTEHGTPFRPYYFIQADTNEILYFYDGLTYAEATGPGGNLKIGKYQYGTDYDGFPVTTSGSTCTMNVTEVKTINLNHGSMGSTPYSFTCPTNTVKEINGAYSPLNDAQYFGKVVFDMYKNWYNTTPLTFQLTMNVHYSTNYENAFWNGSSMTFGDGYTNFHPLVCLDVSAHEVSHGFTQQNSNLNYSGQSGGVNESFSDMAGETAEYYMRSSNDFMVGYDIVKAAGKALRYMDDPTKDGKSIGSALDYTSSMDVHYSSGVFNKAFYLLATTSGWDTRKAFAVFVKANQDYWTASSNFQQCAVGARDAAIDLGYSCGDVRNAFAGVDIIIDCASGPTADFSFVVPDNSKTVTFADQSNCQNCVIASRLWNFGDGTTSSLKDPLHTYAANGTYSVTLTVASNQTPAETASKIKQVIVEAGMVTLFFDDFESDKGWLVNPTSTDTATIGAWERANPQGTIGEGNSQLDDTVSGSYDLVTGALAGSSSGSYDIDGGKTSIRSPQIQLPNSDQINLSFYFYLSHASNATADDYYRVFVQGSSTVKIFEELASADNDIAVWEQKTIDITQFKGQVITILIEAADAGTASLVEAAVDDVKIRYQDEEVPTAAADFIATYAKDGLWQRKSSNGIWTKLSNSEPVKLISGDIDGDGLDELIAVITTGQAGVWVRYTASGLWEKLPVNYADLIALACADINGDGLDDLVGSWTYGLWWRNSAVGNWEKYSNQVPTQITCADFDKDGKADILGSFSTGMWIRYAGTGQWVKQAINQTDLIQIASGDINGDGNFDITGVWTYGCWYRDAVSGIWIKLHKDPASFITIGDVDGSGKDDFIGVWPNYDGTWFRYSDDGSWEKVSAKKPVNITAGRFTN
jgi:Zn-dependent metalloprotease